MDKMSIISALFARMFDKQHTITCITRKKERKFIYLLLAINMVIKITTDTNLYMFILTWHLTLLSKYTGTQRVSVRAP